MIVTTYEDALKTNETLYVPPGYVSVVWFAHRLDPVCGVAFSTNADWPFGVNSTWTLARAGWTEYRRKETAAPTTAQAIVATAARAAPISVRMYPTSSNSGAVQSGTSSLRFRRAIGPSETGGP